MVMKFETTLTDGAMTTAWITMLALLGLGAVGAFFPTFPLQLGNVTIGFILLFSGIVGLFEALYEKGDGFGLKVLRNHISNIITLTGALMALILSIGVFFHVASIMSVLSVWITLTIQFIILLLEGLMKRW